MPGSRWERSWPVADVDAEPLEPVRVLRRVPVAAGHVGAPRVGDDGERRHPRAADPDHVQPAVGERHRASARSSVAIRSPASGRASRRAAVDPCPAAGRDRPAARRPRPRAAPPSARSRRSRWPRRRRRCARRCATGDRP